jgi:CRISPR system Cascade subunit CasC
MFVQLHTLTPYPATLLNRDDAGFAKTLPFGGVTRTRVSSQCLKYHWRNFDGEDAIQNVDAPETVRSRETFRRELADPLIDEGYPTPLAYAGAMSMRTLLLGESKYTNTNDKLKESSFNEFVEAGEEENEEFLHTEQVVVLGRPEIRCVLDLTRGVIGDLQDEFGDLTDDGEVPDDVAEAAYDRFLNFFKKRSDSYKQIDAMRHDEIGLGLNAAMFGRMVTSDILARGDAAIHVAHSFTTHASELGEDYFTAVDELRRDDPQQTGELGAGHVNNQPLTSGLFYSYVVIDVPLLVSNITAAKREEWTEVDRSLAAEVARRFVLVMATVSPGAKLGSTAPYSRAHFLFAETGTTQPRTLANAFQEAVDTKPDKLANSYGELAKYLEGLNGMYAPQTERRLSAHQPPEWLTEALAVDDTSSVEEVAKWVSHQIEGGA